MSADFEAEDRGRGTRQRGEIGRNASSVRNGTMATETATKNETQAILQGPNSQSVRSAHQDQGGPQQHRQAAGDHLGGELRVERDEKVQEHDQPQHWRELDLRSGGIGDVIPSESVARQRLAEELGRQRAGLMVVKGRPSQGSQDVGWKERTYSALVAFVLVYRFL